MKLKITHAVIITAMSAVVFISCRKDHNEQFADNVAADELLLSANKQIEGLPDSLKVPEGNRLVDEGYAEGVQIYQVKRSATNPNVFTWVNIAPLAKLFTKPDFRELMALHFVGPTWQIVKGHNHGQTVVGRKLVGVTPDASAIQWLLLQAVDSLSSANNNITYIQRINTVGGLAPTSGADEAHLGQLDSIPYRAKYLFYERK